MNHDAHLTIFTDTGLSFGINLDEENEPDRRCPSLYILSGHLQIRQFATQEQLIELRDMLIKAFPIEEGVFK